MSDANCVKGKNMRRSTRSIPRLFLAGLLPLFLAACGGGDDNTAAEALLLYSSAVYGGHSMVVTKTGTTYSWGANGYGQVGNGKKVDKYSPFALSGTYSAVSIGGAHSVALDAVNGGNVWTWGHNISGQLGNDSIVTSTTPIQVPGLTGITAIAAGGKHTLALAADKTVWAWGENSNGQLGNGTTVNSLVPVQVLNGAQPLSGIVAIAAGGHFSLALKEDGTVLAWGSNVTGELGNNSTVNSSLPVQVLTVVPPANSSESSSAPRTLTGITAIAAGGSHVLALDQNGVVWSWGYNFYGQLGDGTTKERLTAVKVVVPTGVVGKINAVSAGLDHSAALLNGTVYAWGYNYYGQVGNGAALSSDTPVKSPSAVIQQGGGVFTNIVAVTATGHHCIAQSDDGRVWTWGRNTYGQLGNNSIHSLSSAVAILP